jgi:hypothetical protein
MMSLIHDRQLGQVGPYQTAVLIQTGLNWWDEQKVKALVPEFPALFEQAETDFVKLKLGVERNLFTPAQIATAMNWFSEFPQLWETIRLNFIKTEQGREFGGRVDDFCGRIKRSELYRSSSLGFAPVVIAGIVIVGGVAAGLWAVGYIARQRNVSKMIDQVTAGALPPEVLVEAMKAEQTSGLFAGLGRIGYAIAFAAAAWVAVGFFGRKR